MNSKALELAGVTADTPDPVDGRIERDPETKAPTGTLHGVRLRTGGQASCPSPRPPSASTGLRRALALFNGYGITAVHEADAGRRRGGAGARADPRRRIARRSARPADGARAWPPSADAARGPEQVDDLVKLRQEFTSARVKPIAAKIFADGVIEPKDRGDAGPLPRQARRGAASRSVTTPALERPSSRAW